MAPHVAHPNNPRVHAFFFRGGTEESENVRTEAGVQTRLDHIELNDEIVGCGRSGEVDCGTRPVFFFLNAQKPERAAAARSTRSDGEDARSIVLISHGRWSLTEIIGQWDAGWGYNRT